MPRDFRRVLAALALVGVLLGALQAWAARHVLNADGVSYLDLGEALARGDLRTFVNGYWSPLYPALQGIVARLARPSLEGELPLAHAVNFAIFLFAGAAFVFYLVSLLPLRRAPAERVPLPPALLAIFGGGFFLAASLAAISLSLLTPDLLASALLFLSAALLARLRAGARVRRTGALLGLALGLGYLARAPLFLASFVFLAAAHFAAGRGRAGRRCAGSALAAFLLVSGPWIAALSASKGRLTFSDTGKLAYLWYVNGTTFRHWQGDAHGVPAHTTRRVVDAPPVYEFAGPIGGTYPAWTDPSYWYEGARVVFQPRRQWRRLIAGARSQYGTFLSTRDPGLFGEPLVAFLFFTAAFVTAAALALAGGARVLRGTAHTAFLWIPAVAGAAQFLPVYSEPRHVVAYALVGGAAFLAGLTFPDSKVGRGALRVAGATLGAAALLLVVVPEGVRAAQTAQEPPRALIVARAVRAHGLAPGTRVASLDYATRHSPWARLARVRIVAEVHESVKADNAALFWNSPPAARARVLDAFRAAGAAFAVSERGPRRPGEKGWRRVGGDGAEIFVFPLS